MSTIGASEASVSAKELKKRDFILHGNIWKVVFVLAAPLFLYALFNYIYGIIDTIMCSGISKEAVNAVGALKQVADMISAIGAGIGAGGSILIAREIGRKDYGKAKRLSSSVFAFTFLIAIITCAVVIPLTVPILRLFGISEASIAIGQGYFMISVATSAIMMVNTVYMGVEKAKGSTLVITLLNMAVVLIKIGLNSLFLYGLSLKDMTFVSLSTLIANACLLLFVLIRLSRKSYLFHFSFHNLDLHKGTLNKITWISFPIFLGKFIFSLGKVTINALAGKGFGDDVVGALGVSNNLGGSITNPISSVEDSTSAIISTNLGAHNSKRAINTFYVGLVYALSIALVGVTLITIFNDPITLFFARNAGSEEEVATFAKEISSVFFYEKMGIITLAINSAVLGLLYGFGYTRLSMTLNIARVFVFRIPSFLVCEYLIKPNGVPLTGFQCAGISMGFSNIAIGIMALVTAIIVIYRVKRKERIKEESIMLSEDEKQQLNGFCSSYLKGFSHYKPNGAWCYEDGVVLGGSFDMYKATRDKSYLAFCTDYMKENIQDDGTMNYKEEEHSLDDLEPGVTLFNLKKNTHVDKYEKAMDKLKALLDEQPRTPSGSYFHKGKYPNQIWLDGLYMALPFEANLASESKKHVYTKDIKLQFENAEKFNKDPSSGLYYHCYDETKSMQWADKETGRSPNVWLRSVGWLAMALVDVYSIYKNNHWFILAKPLKKMLNEVLVSMEPYMDKETMMWKDLPTISDSKNYFEASGSLMLAYAYMKGARVGVLPYSDMKKGSLIFEGIVGHSFRDSHLEDICLVSGLDAGKRDGSVAYYLSEPVTKDDAKGVGPLMMAYSEYLAMPF